MFLFILKFKVNKGFHLKLKKLKLPPLYTCGSITTAWRLFMLMDHAVSRTLSANCTIVGMRQTVFTTW